MKKVGNRKHEVRKTLTHKTKIWCKYLLSRECHEKLKNVIDLITQIRNSMTKCHHTQILKGIQKQVYLSILGLRYLLRQLEIHKLRSIVLFFDAKIHRSLCTELENLINSCREPLQTIIWFALLNMQYVSPWMNHKIFTARYTDTRTTNTRWLNP